MRSSRRSGSKDFPRAVILAGGKGTRLAPYTAILPKPLVPVGEYPVLEILLRQLKAAGIESVVLTVGHLAGLIMTYFGDGSRFGVKIEYVIEEVPLGTAGPLVRVTGLNDTFLVMNGDLLTTLDYTDFLKHHRANGEILTIASRRRAVPIEFGLMDINGNRLIKFTEKPKLEYSVSMGIYVFEPAVLKYIKRGEKLDFPDLVQRLLAAGEPVGCYPCDRYWLDIGRPEDYQQAQEDFEKMKRWLLPREKRR